MTTHRYDRSAIIGDYVRGGIGFALTGVPFFFVPMVGWLSLIFGSFGLLFGVYLVRTWMRSATVVEVDDTGIRVNGPRDRAIPWDALTGLELRYFSTRRDKQGGWMQMVVRGDGTTLGLESSLDGFETVAARVATVAARNQLALSDTTRDNLRALGLAAGAGVGSMGAIARGAASRDDGREGF